MVTNIVLAKHGEVQQILDMSRSGENLRSISIVPESDITPYILETCEVDKNESFFHQIPTCFEARDDAFVIYHELRSVGYNLGYLRKVLPFPVLGLLNNRHEIANIGAVLACFLFINVLALLSLQHFFIIPIRNLTALLRTPDNLDVSQQPFRVRELRALARAIGEAHTAVRTFQERTTALEVEAKLGAMASQVAHDIRSPLAALNAAISDLSEVAEDKRVLIRSAARSIEDITTDLAGRTPLEHKSDTDDARTPHLLSSLVDAVVSERRLQYRERLGLSIDSPLNEHAYGLFALIEPSRFKRVLSNLINNSVEALPNSGHVSIRLESQDSRVRILVTDDGVGIPQTLLPQVTLRGITHGKSKGSGLGLSYAKEVVESWGGELHIASEEGHGTTVSIALDQHPPPNWFLPHLEIDGQDQVMILDDDSSIHRVWMGRFKGLNFPETKLLHFTRTADVLEYFRGHDPSAQRFVFLCDHEILNDDLNGIDVIERLGISDRSVLVTSRYEDVRVREACERLDLRLVPKGLAWAVPIHVQTIKAPPAFVLIDDDELHIQTWRAVARRQHISIATFPSPRDFYRRMSTIPKTAHIYIDSQLQHGLRGEEIARDIHDKGFTEIYLTTGHYRRDWPNMPWIKGIVDKGPPFREGMERSRG